MAAVGDAEDRKLRTLQALLDHDRGAGAAERLLDQHRLDGAAGLLQAAADDHALAERQAVGFDRHPAPVPAREIEGRTCLCEDPVAGRRDGGTSHQLFGEGHDDILVAGSTIHDESQDALSAILAEWTSSNSYATRVNNLRSGGGVSCGARWFPSR